MKFQNVNKSSSGVSSPGKGGECKGTSSEDASLSSTSERVDKNEVAGSWVGLLIIASAVHHFFTTSVFVLVILVIFHFHITVSHTLES